MLALSDILESIVIGNPLLQLGLRHRLLNLSQLSKYLRPMVEVRAKKEVKEATILMALSRLQQRLSKDSPQRENYRINNLVIHTRLCTCTFTKTEETHRQVHEFYTAVQQQKGYITISEGVSEITIIFAADCRALMSRLLTAAPLYEHGNLASIGVTFDPVYTTEVPGFLAIILQQLMLQRINIIEVSSTFTELVLYLDEAETQMAFDTLYTLFIQKQEF